MSTVSSHLPFWSGRDAVSNSKKLALIVIGYVLAVVVGFVAAAVNEALMSEDVSQDSPVWWRSAT